jgi:hypothetical protein
VEAKDVEDVEDVEDVDDVEDVEDGAQKRTFDGEEEPPPHPIPV